MEARSVQERSGRLLHVGCGGDPMPEWARGYTETRLDIDARHSPDILASMTDMGEIGDFDLVYCSHALEHLYPHEVAIALGEFRRVLKPGGGAVVFVPDLEGVYATEDVLFDAPCGPITGLDLIYGYRRVLADMPHMAHHSGFTAATLAQVLSDAGFEAVEVKRMDAHNLMGAARAA